VYRAPVRPQSSPKRWTRLTVLAVALPLGLAACSSAASTTTTTRAAGHQGSTSVCAMVTPPEIHETLNRSVHSPGVTNSTLATACTYLSATSDPADAVIVAFRSKVTNAASAAERIALASRHGSTTDVSGAGNTAFYYQETSGGATVTSLVTLVNGTQVTVSSTASLAQSEALTARIFQSFATAASTTTTTTTSP
jgi:hypothetical protein